MRINVFLILSFLIACSATSLAQNSPYKNFPIYYNDTVIWHKIESLDSLIAANRKGAVYERGNYSLSGDPGYDLNRQGGLDNLLGMTKESASAVISKYNHLDFKPEHS